MHINAGCAAIVAAAFCGDGVDPQPLESVVGAEDLEHDHSHLFMIATNRLYQAPTILKYVRDK